MRRSVDETHSEVMLDALNRFAVNNDEEHELLMDYARRASNMTLELNNKRSKEDEHKLSLLEERDPQIDVDLEKRNGGLTHPSDMDWSSLPDFFCYWEQHVGMADPEHQQGCGACWAFPTTAAMEALYKDITGEPVKFSTQYFIDCSFSYSGCAGGTVNDGFKITKDRQFVLGEWSLPLIASYKKCTKKMGDKIKSGEDNAMKKVWFQDFYPLGRDETAFLKGLRHSPVAFGGYISENYYAYVSGVYDDALCAVEPMAHAQLLVGYTEKIIRVRGSFGLGWGDYGYINYKRGSDNMRACRLFDHAYAIVMTPRREIEYDWCNDARPTTRARCRQSCKAKDVPGKTGWDLAVIPTVYHNNEILKMANDKYPGIKADEKFNLLWVGLSDPTKKQHYYWTDKNWHVNYFNYTRDTKKGKFGLLDKNNGGWEMRSSTNFQARGICSRAMTCFDIEFAIEHATVVFTLPAGEDTLAEGTTAALTCDEGCVLEGDALLTCQGGHWAEDEYKDLPKCKCAGETEEVC